MDKKEQAFKIIMEFFSASEYYLYKEAVNKNFFFLYNEWNKRGYARLDINDLYSIKKLNLSMLGLKYIPEELEYLDTLEYLNIAGNYIDKLPDLIWKLYNLKELYIGSPVFGGNNITEISSKIKNLQNLEILDISLCDNLITLPKELLELDNLSYLRLTQYNLYKSKIAKLIRDKKQCNILLEDTLPPINKDLYKKYV